MNHTFEYAEPTSVEKDVGVDQSYTYYDVEKDDVENDAAEKADQSYSYYDVEKDAAEKGDQSYTYYDELSGSGEGNY